LSNFIDELKRRKVFRVTASYAVVAWIIMQIGEVTFPALRLPDWVLTAVVVILLIGFPVVAIIAWIFDRTPDGIVITPSNSETSVNEPMTQVGNMDVKVDTRPFYLQKRNIFLVLGVLAGIIIGQFNLFDSEEKLVNYTGDRIPVAIADFENNTNDASLDGLSGLLITSLEQSKYLSVLTKSRMFDLLKQIGKVDIEKVDEKLGVEICERANINTLVLTSIRQFGDLYSVDLKILDVDKNEYLYTTNVQAEGKKNIPDLIDQISKQTRISLAEQAEEVEKNQREIASLTTKNLEAYKYYDLGEKAMFSFAWNEAEKNFLKAIEFDSTFAMAHYNLAYTYQWFFNSKQEEYINKAVKYIESAPDKERLYIRAHSIKDFQSRIPIYQEIIDKYPNEKYAYFEIGDMLWHNAESEKSIDYFKKSLALDPTFEFSIQHLSWAYRDVDMHDESIDLANNALKIYPDKPSYKESQFVAYRYAGKFKEYFSLARDLEQSEVKILNPDRIFGDGYLISGDYDNAKEKYLKLLSNDETETTGLYKLKEHSLYRGDYEKYIFYSDKLLQKFFEEDNNRSYVNELTRRAFVLAFTFDKMKDSKRIINEIDVFFNDKAKNIRIDNLSLASRLLLLETYAIHGFWDKIDDEKMKSVNFYGPMKDRYTALRFHEEGDHSSSLKALNNWPDLIGGPMQFLVYYQIGMDYRYLNQHKKSLEYFNKIKYTYDTWFGLRGYYHPVLFLYAGLANFELENYRLAKSNLETFLKIWEPAPDSLKQKKMARETLKKINKVS